VEKKAAISPEMVQEFVGNAHGDPARVKELLQQEPGLVNAAWDWGGGDWETALGAAAHMGRRDIAELLLEHGARMDIFAAAMLGHVDVVKAIIAAAPGARTAPGPHGIPLLAHARAGGATAIIELLESLS
jgi:ankyrin repeat protein